MPDTVRMAAAPDSSSQGTHQSSLCFCSVWAGVGASVRRPAMAVVSGRQGSLEESRASPSSPPTVSCPVILESGSWFPEPGRVGWHIEEVYPTISLPVDEARLD